VTKALQETYLSWNLTLPVSYQAGQELECTISFTAPEAGKYYLLGALYTTSLEYISGTLFGLLLSQGADYGVNSKEYTSLWELGKSEEKELTCKFTFDRSNIVLGLFLMKMVDDKPSLDADEQVGSLSTQLSSPAPPITVESLIPLVMVVSMGGFIMYEALKD
jgi:hypothetical protein